MVDRTAAGADPESVRRSDGNAHVGFGFLRRSLKRKPLGESGCDGGTKRAAGTVGVFGRNARRSQANATAGLDQKIDTFPTGSEIVVEMAAFDQHSANAEFQQRLRLCAHFLLVARLRRIE